MNMQTTLISRTVLLRKAALAAALLAVGTARLLAVTTLQLEFKYEDSGTTTTNGGSLAGGPMNLLDAADVPTDLHGAPGSGLLGGTDQALDLTSATGMGSGFTGPWGSYAFSTPSAPGASWTAISWYKTAGGTALGNSARVMLHGTDVIQMMGGAGGGAIGQAAVFAPGSPGTVNSGASTYPETGTWVFFATTYSNGVVSFYKGDTVNPVAFVSSAPFSTAAATTVNSVFWVGNRSTHSRPFDGYLDNTRFYNDGGAGDTSGALSLEMLEIMRKLDLGLPVPPIASLPLISPSNTVWAGTPVTLTEVTAGGIPTSYQWRKDGTNVPGATTNILFLASPTPADSGSYDVEVSNGAGTTTSPSVTLTVRSNIPPTFLSQPFAGTRYLGGYIHFAPILDGPPPFHYQWFFNSTAIPDATNRVLHISNLVATNAGTYKLYVTNAFGTTPSADLVISTVSVTPGTYEQMIVTNQPTAYWRLNEAGPNPVAGYDFAGGNDVTNLAVASTSGPQPSGGFPGLESGNTAFFYDSFLSSGSSTVGPLMNSMSNFTLCGWFNIAYAPPQRTALFGQDGQAELGFPTVSSLAIYVAGGTSVSIPLSGINLGQWYFIAAVADATNNTVKLYLNGTEVALAAGVKTQPATTTPFHIGFGVLDATENWFDGAIDEVALFDRPLSAVQLNALYSKAAGIVAPAVMVDPVPATRYAGAAVTFKVQASGTLPLSYQWKKGGVNLSNGGNISGATTDTLTISPIASANEDDYSVQVSNSAGNALSASAHLTVVTAPANAYATNVIALTPDFYWELNEGAGTAYDYCGGLNGTYGVNALAVAGPRSPAFPGFDPANNALQCASPTGGAAVTLPPLQLNTDVCTITAWVNPAEVSSVWRGLLYSSTGTSPDIGGLFLASNNELRYTWNNQNFGWSSGLLVPTNKWSFVAVVITPTNTSMYLGTPTNFLISSSAALTNNVQAFAANAYIGQWNPGTGYFLGSIDDVAVYRRALTLSQLGTLYNVGSGASGVPLPVTLSITRSGADVILTWPQGILQAADVVTGAYTNVSGATSPWTVTPVEALKFYRVRVQ